MGLFNSTKKVAGRIVDVRVDKWMSWDYIAETTDRLKSILLDVVIPKKATYSETFEEAMQRMELTEEDIQQRQKEFSRLFYYFLAMAFVIIGYALFMAFRGSMVTSLISFCLSMYAFTQAFRFHFWLFQIKHRKLGCTIKEWMNSKISSHETSQAIVPVENKKEIRTEKTMEDQDKTN